MQVKTTKGKKKSRHCQNRQSAIETVFTAPRAPPWLNWWKSEKQVPLTYQVLFASQLSLALSSLSADSKVLLYLLSSIYQSELFSPLITSIKKNVFSLDPVWKIPFNCFRVFLWISFIKTFLQPCDICPKLTSLRPVYQHLAFSYIVRWFIVILFWRWSLM